MHAIHGVHVVHVFFTCMHAIHVFHAVHACMHGCCGSCAFHVCMVMVHVFFMPFMHACMVVSSCGFQRCSCMHAWLLVGLFFCSMPFTHAWLFSLFSCHCHAWNI